MQKETNLQIDKQITINTIVKSETKEEEDNKKDDETRNFFINSKRLTIFVLLIGTIMYIFNELIVVNPFNVSNYKHHIDTNYSYQYWKKLTPKRDSESPHLRQVSTNNFNISFDYIKSELNSMAEILTTRFEGLLNAKVYEEIESNNPVMQSNLIYRIGPSLDSPPIVISAHLDTNDNAIGIASMLGIARYLSVESPSLPKIPIAFLFIGREGLNGRSSFFIKKKQMKKIATFVNIESMGPGLPLIVARKGAKSSETIRAWNSRGQIFVAVINDVLKAGVVKSTSDYAKAGIPGIEALFVGDPSRHHEIDDIAAITQRIFNFIFEYNPDAKEEDAAAVGVSPLVIKITIKKLKLLGIIFGVTGVLLVILTFPEQIFRSLIAFAAGLIVTAVPIIAIAFALANTNIVSYFDNYIISFVCFSIILIPLFAFTANIINYSKWYPEICQLLLLFISSSLLLVTRGMDISVLFLLIVPCSIVGYFSASRHVSIFTNLIGYYPIFVFGTVLLRVSVGYHGMITLIPPISILGFSAFSVLSFLPMLVSKKD